MKKNDLKILLIVPRYSFLTEALYSYNFPLGIAYISAVLKKANINVSCLNINHRNGSTREIVKLELDKKHYDIVATGHNAFGYPMVEDIFKAARKHESKPKLILGGPIITSEPQLMFESLKPDFGVLGEGEETILELVDCIGKKKDLKKVDGIMYKDKNQNIIKNPLRKPIKNIGDLPFPDIEGFEVEKKLSHQYANSEGITVLFDYPRQYPITASRGCPFQCTFCYHPEGEYYRERGIKNVIEELRFAVSKYKINFIQLYDDLFSSRKERVLEFCKEIKKLSKETNQKIKWFCQLSPAHLNNDIELLKTMKDAGCEVISWGFESYSPEILKSMRKPITPQQIDTAIKLTIEARINLQGNFIFGDIAETKETAQTTMDYYKENCKGQVLLTGVQPYPGSAIYKHCVEKGIIKDKLDFIKNKMPNRDFLNITNKMSDKEFLELINTISKLMAKHTKAVKSRYIKKTGENIYEISLKCPHCNKENIYKNFYIKSLHLYQEFILCRNCNRRFFVASPAFNILIKTNLTRTIAKIYHKLVKRENRIIWKK
jgi:radical SAM superfamily enzyme YgiQ (UPF0313 family)